MFGNYLKIALRIFRRNKTFTFINIAGLTLGISASLLIMLYVFSELGFENMHDKRNRIYRVAGELEMGGKSNAFAALFPPMAPLLESEFPEVEEAVRILRASDVLENISVELDERRFAEPDFFMADEDIFTVFSMPLLKGDPATALDAPFSVVITEETATKYFGNDNPIGQVLQINGRYDFTISGLLKNMPNNTQLHCDLIASYSTLAALPELQYDIWGRLGTPYTYLLVSEEFNAEQFDAKLPAFLASHVPPRLADMTKLFVQPFSRIYLHSDLKMELQPSGNLAYVHLFSVLAAAILLIACINFMNLATARSAQRMREVGMRKAIGAQRRQLIGQFLGESCLFALLASILSFGLFAFLRPIFARFMERDLSLSCLGNFWILPALLLFAVVVGIVAGLYPAFFLSRFQTINMLKGARRGGSKSRLRRFLVVFQFAISITLIVATLIIQRQLQYVKHKDLGFAREQVLSIPIDDPALQGLYPGLKNEILRLPGVINLSGAFSYPGAGAMIKLSVQPGEAESSDPIIMQAVSADYGFIEALGLKIRQGRDFSEAMGRDARTAIILNQSALAEIGWNEPIGKQLRIPDMARRGEFIDAEVIAVVQDFHMRSLHEKIEPLFIRIDPSHFRSILLRVEPTQLPHLLSSLEKIWNQYSGNTAFQYHFIDAQFEKQYRADERLARLIVSFCLLSIVIACLGLFGLSAYTAERRRKEIGVRRVLGASIGQVSLNLTVDFLKWVVLANVFAVPLAWFYMHRWLQNFAYRIHIHWWIFAMAGMLALLIALVTIGYQSLRAALINPVECLRHE